MLANHSSLFCPVESDAQCLTKIALQSKAHWGYTDEFMQACELELTVSKAKVGSQRYLYRGYRLEGDIVGYFCLEWIDTQCANLDALFVLPSHMGTGIGKYLFDNAIAELKVNHRQQLIIHSDPQARGFYQRLGCVYLGEVASGSIANRTLPELRYTIAGEE